MGRIYRVMPKGAERYWTTMPQGADSLIALLGHANGWVRDKAQQVLVDRHATDVVGKLREILRSGRNHVKVVHALDRKGAVEGKSGSGRVDQGGCRSIKKK